MRRLDVKARQLGFSTLFALIYLDDTIARPNTITGIIAHKKESLGYLWEIIRLAHATMPEALRPKLIDDSKTQLSFDNNSKIMVSLKIQSTAVHNLHVSEFAFCDPNEIEQTVAACPPHANISFETTANGMNHVHAMWEDDDTIAKRFHPWFLDTEYRYEPSGPLEWAKDELRLAAMAKRDYGIVLDDRQIQFRRQKQKDLRQLFAQEFAEDAATCFLASGSPFFNKFKIAELQRRAKEYTAKNPPTEKDDYVMWEPPTKKHIYAAGADSSGGKDPKAGDWSVLAIFCVTCGKQAFRYRARVPTADFFRVCDEWGRKYNNALLAPETNNMGAAVVLGLEEVRYPNLYQEDPVKDAAFGAKPRETARNHGWDTTVNTRPILLSGIQQAIEGDFHADADKFIPAVQVLDQIFLSECLTFVNTGGKIEADVGKHDDTVFAWAIAYQMFLRLKGKASGFRSDSFFVGGQSESSRIFG